MNRQRNGFTLVEILVVVAIVALIATIGIPNLIRSRTTANESTVVGNLRTLTNGLAMYRSTTNAYPTSWLDDMYTNADPDFGPGGFQVDLQAAPLTTRGYRYQYGPPAGPPLITFAMVASPAALGLTGTRTFWTDHTAEIHHCIGDAPVTTAVPVGVRAVQEPPDPCP